MYRIAFAPVTDQTWPIMRNLLKIALLSCAFMLPLATTVASAEQPRLQMAQSGCKSLNQAVEQVRRQYPNGRIISADTKRQGNSEVHHIRVMVDGKVRTVKVNGCSRG